MFDRFSGDGLDLLLECRGYLLSVLRPDKDARPIERTLFEVGLSAFGNAGRQNVHIILRELGYVGSYTNQHTSCANMII